MKTAKRPRYGVPPDAIWEPVTIRLPTNVIATLQEIATAREMSTLEALLRFYIGQGLREDLSREFYSRVLNHAAQVLARHNHSPEEVEALVEEIRLATLDEEAEEDI
jgi:hypothetical protein